MLLEPGRSIYKILTNHFNHSKQHEKKKKDRNKFPDDKTK